MQPTNLYRVECCVVDLSQPVIELARARSYKEAAQIVRSFLLEFDESPEVEGVTVQLLREPEEVGICYEPSGATERFILKNGFLAKPGRRLRC